MRIKRFHAPDMRTALRMIRDEQGADAVILSNRAIDGGIEVVAATDYDEALVAQALRAALPPPADPAARVMPMPAPVAAAVAAPPPTLPAGYVAEESRHAPVHRETAAARASAPARHSLMTRARAVFNIGDGPTLAELAALPATPAEPVPAAVDTGRFDAMMAALEARAARAPAPMPSPVASGAPVPGVGPDTAAATPATSSDRRHAVTPSFVSASPSTAGTGPVEAPPAEASAMPAMRPRLLHVVEPDAALHDPVISAMRDELASMRRLMETQMDQLGMERLRGSPARAAAFDALLRFGCDESLAQAVAGRIDPRLAPDAVTGPLIEELARVLTISRGEPLDDGGVIALVGPTGAGKTTAAAKLAARFAARHRARDVALVSTDDQRAGAREQLQAHGRRLGITVCEAAGPEGLQDALAQLVDYPLVLVDTSGHAPGDRALFRQILWLRSARRVRSLLVLPANAHPEDLSDVVRRYRPAGPEGVVLTKLDETGRPGSVLSVAVRHGLSLAYACCGQQVPADLDVADATRLVQALQKPRRAADNPVATEDHHAVA